MPAIYRYLEANGRLFRAIAVSELGSRVAASRRPERVGAHRLGPRAARASDSTPTSIRRLRGIVGLIASFDAYDTLTDVWGLDHDEAADVAAWSRPGAVRPGPTQRGRVREPATRRRCGGRSPARAPGPFDGAHTRRAGHAARAGRVPRRDGRRLPQLHRSLRAPDQPHRRALRQRRPPTARCASPACRPSDRPPPPAWLLRVLTRVHPELRRRDRQARRALGRRTWHDDLRRWFDELRPARLASRPGPAGRRSRRVSTTTRSPPTSRRASAELAAGLQRALLARRRGGRAGGPATSSARRSEGRSAADAITDLTGAAARIHRGDAARVAPPSPTRSPGPASSRPPLDDVRQASPAAAAALDAYLAEYGQRVVGAFDVTGRRLVELPERRAAVHPPPPAAERRRTAGRGAARRRRRSPTTPGSRSPHATTTPAISCILAPRPHSGAALLVAGVRLHEAGAAATTPTTCSTAPHREVAALLRRRPLARRRRPGCSTAPRLAAPPRRRSRPHRCLGAAAGSSRPGSCSRPRLRRVAAAMGAFLGDDGGAPASEDPRRRRSRRDRRRRRCPTGGRAVVAVDPDDAIARLEPGDVLVTTTTTPAFNCVLPVAGALVTAHGGLMSHAGIAARELGIPAVLGVADAAGPSASPTAPRRSRSTPRRRRCASCARRSTPDSLATAASSCRRSTALDVVQGLPLPGRQGRLRCVSAAWRARSSAFQSPLEYGHLGDLAAPHLAQHDLAIGDLLAVLLAAADDSVTKPVDVGRCGRRSSPRR